MLWSGKLDKKWWEVTRLTPSELMVSGSIHSPSFELIGSFVHTLLVTSMKDTWERTEREGGCEHSMHAKLLYSFLHVGWIFTFIDFTEFGCAVAQAVLPGACCLPQTLCAGGYSECLQPQEVAAISICNLFSNVLLIAVRELPVLLSKLHLFLSHQAHLCMQLVWSSLQVVSWFLCLYPVEPLYCPSLKYVRISV